MGKRSEAGGEAGGEAGCEAGSEAGDRAGAEEALDTDYAEEGVTRAVVDVVGGKSAATTVEDGAAFSGRVRKLDNKERSLLRWPIAAKRPLSCGSENGRVREHWRDGV